MSNFLVMIDPGHPSREGDTGTAHGELVEYKWTWACANELAQILKSADIAYELTRQSEDEVLSISQRAALAEKYQASLFVCIHVNAAPHGDASGLMAFYWPGNRTTEQVSDEIANSAPGPLRRIHPCPTPGDKDCYPNVHYILRKAPCDAVLVECGFATNKQDNEFLMSADGPKSCARAIFEGVKKYRSLKGYE